jgi:hypothetical protein
MASRKSPADSSLSRPVTWVREWLQRPVKLEMRGAQVHLTLGERVRRDAGASTQSSAGAALRRGHEELQALLRRHPETRHLMRHLAFVEQSVGRFGSRALRREVPVPVLRKAVEQLDLLTQGKPGETLAELRARMVGAIASRGEAPPADADTETRPGSLEVTEASPSQFDEVERSWTGTLPVPDPGSLRRRVE